MAGRYDGWHHKTGLDRASPEDLAGARKVLGALENDMRLGNVPSGSRKVMLPNGTVVTAAITMGVPSVKIEPAGGGQVLIPARELGEFITVPRSQAAPTGVNAEHPEVMLRKAPTFWRSYFYGSPPTSFTGQGGSYADMFPQGLGQGGNADWVGPDGERLSWYGPSSRAFVDGYVHAKWQHGKRVFYLGDVLLDTDEYLAKTPEDPGFADRYICGAALRRIDGTWWLYTIQYPGQDGATPAPVTGSAELNATYSYPLALQSLAGGLHRYRLLKTDDDQGVVRFQVVRGSREFLRVIGTGSPDAWFFNRQGTEAICHLAFSTFNTPGKPWWGARVPSRDNPPDEDDDVPAGVYHDPATAALQWRLTIDADGTSTSFVETNPSCVSGGVAAPVTGDYDPTTDALVTYGIRFGSDLVPYLAFDGTEAALYQSTLEAAAGTAGGDLITGTSRNILYASPRDHVVVLLKREVHFDTGATPQLQYHRLTVELYVDGALAHSALVAEAPDAKYGLVQQWGDSTDYLDALAGKSITPQWFIHGLLIVYQNTFDPPGPPVPGDENSWRSVGHFIGANPMFAQFPYPAACWFGVADSNIAPGELSQSMQEVVTPGFNGNVADDNGYFAVTGCARHEGVVVASCWIPREGMNASFSFVTSASLQALTTVGGTNARYHPIRLLGKMPTEDRKEQTP